MIQHFLEWVRTHYYLNTNHIDEKFRNNLTANQASMPKMVGNMVEMIHEVRLSNIASR